MLKKVGVLTLAILYSVTMLSIALNFHPRSHAAVKTHTVAKTCNSIANLHQVKSCQDSLVMVKVKDAHQQEESKSFLSKLFLFDLPRLPFEDFILAAQKALLEKLFDRGASNGLF